MPHTVEVLPASHLVPLQQPVGHDAAVHTQAPPTHACPAWQAAPLPHRQTPEALHPSAVGPQLAHAPPAVPHCAADDRHWSCSQQPDAQLVASHRHAPARQRCPAAQAAPVPQAHAPDAEQLSDFVASHARHMAPDAAQVPTPGGLHVVPLQHPDGQLAASHTHIPFSHRWPVPHAALPPQRHLPEPLHVSARCGSQATHAAPFFPHAITLGVAHALPEQHPLGHVVALQPPPQTPAEHVPPSQLWHWAPPTPQLAEVVPVRHVPSLAQQPVVQLVLSQTQVPPEQRWPAAHAGPVPHAHAPLTQAFAVAPHVAHCAPPEPHAAVDAATHAAP